MVEIAPLHMGDLTHRIGPPSDPHVSKAGPMQTVESALSLCPYRRGKRTMGDVKVSSFTAAAAGLTGPQISSADQYARRRVVAGGAFPLGAARLINLSA